MVRKLEVVNGDDKPEAFELSPEAEERLQVFATVASLCPTSTAVEICTAADFILTGLEADDEEEREVEAEEVLTKEDLEAAEPGACVRIMSKGEQYYRVRLCGGEWSPFGPRDGYVLTGVSYDVDEMMSEAGLTGEVWRYVGDYMQWGIKSSDIGFGGEAARA